MLAFAVDVSNLLPTFTTAALKPAIAVVAVPTPAASVFVRVDIPRSSPD